MSYNDVMAGAFGPHYRITKNNMLCVPALDIGPKRTHRRARIRKKWLKRYGRKTQVCDGHGPKGLNAYQLMGQGIVACPHAFDRILSGCEVAR